MSLLTTSLSRWAGALRNMFKTDSPSPSSSTSQSQTPTTPVTQEIIPAKTMAAPQQHFEYTSAGTSIEMDQDFSLRQRMEEAKALYPGSKNWAKDEERLFEILYLRQDLPMLPSHWNLDFRGFPIPEHIFDTSDEYIPIVYAHSSQGSAEFAATAAITRLIDLTQSVRMIIEAPPPQGAFGQKAVRRKAARVIHDSLQRYCAWAARDGGYDKLKVIPNLIAEVVDAPETQESLVKYMNDRMGDLSRLQREFYRADHDRSLWSPARARLARKDKRSLGRLDKSSGKIVRAGLKRGFLSDDTTPPSTPGLSWDSQTASTPGSTPRLPSAKRRRYGSPSVDDRTMMDDYYLQSPDIKADMDHEASMSFKSEVSMVDEVPLANVAPRPSTPINEDEIMYRRQPPVVYGLFIIGTSIFLLTADSSKGEDAYISFHVDMDFADKFQSVWNALTVAIAVCSARDELMSRLDDFAPTTSVYDSDPDA